ncbi:DUF2200 domain-containing protein [Myroides sp. LJL115]
MKNNRVYQMTFASIYPLYINKVEKKARTVLELDLVITWLTGYDPKAIQQTIINKYTLEEFFDKAPNFNENAYKITGSICGYKVQEIEEELMRKIRYLDKLVDELAKGKKMENILRK